MKGSAMPKVTKPISDALNEQINRELESAYVYLAMSASGDPAGLADSSAVDRDIGRTRRRAAPIDDRSSSSSSAASASI